MKTCRWGDARFDGTMPDFLLFPVYLVYGNIRPMLSPFLQSLVNHHRCNYCLVRKHQSHSD